MNLLKTTILILMLLIITSCAGKREQTYHNKKGCNVVCIGDVEFKNQSAYLSTDFNYDDSKRNSFWPNKTDNCITKQYPWNTIDQKEIDRGLQICSAQIGWNNKSESVYHCGPYDSNLDEKTNILRSLNSCEDKLNKYRAQKAKQRANTISYEDYMEEKKKEKERKEQQQKVNNAKQTCRSLGFTEAQDIAECGLKFLTTEKYLNNSGATTTNNDVLERQIQLNNAIRLMQLGKNILDPPKQKTVNCRYTFTGWTCN